METSKKIDKVQLVDADQLQEPPPEYEAAGYPAQPATYGIQPAVYGMQPIAGYMQPPIIQQPASQTVVAVTPSSQVSLTFFWKKRFKSIGDLAGKSRTCTFFRKFLVKILNNNNNN